jgi:hypothetical protein
MKKTLHIICVFFEKLGKLSFALFFIFFVFHVCARLYWALLPLQTNEHKNLGWQKSEVLTTVETGKNERFSVQTIDVNDAFSVSSLGRFNVMNADEMNVDALRIFNFLRKYDENLKEIIELNSLELDGVKIGYAQNSWGKKLQPHDADFVIFNPKERKVYFFKFNSGVN